MDRTIAEGERHVYGTELAAGDFLRVVVEQRGVDLIVEAVGPNGERLVEVDSPIGRHGPESLTLIAEGAGAYRIAVRPFPLEPAADYTLTSETPRPADRRDRRWMATERAQLEAYRLHQRKDAESLRAAIAIYRGVLEDWRALGAPEEKAEVLYRLAVEHRLLGKNMEASDFLTLALTAFRQNDNPRGEAKALNQMGLLHWSQSEHEQATEAYGKALALWKSLGDLSHQGRIANNLGVLYQLAGKFDDALAAYQEALTLFRQTGDRQREPSALNNIGSVLWSRGDLLKSLTYSQEALELAKATQNRRNEAEALNTLGSVYQELGEDQKALDYFNQARPIFASLGDRRRLSLILGNLGFLYFQLQDPDQALDLLGKSLEIHEEVNDRRGLARGLGIIATIYDSLGLRSRASATYRRSLAIRQEIGDRAGEAEMLSHLGALLAHDQPEEALRLLRPALDLRETFGDRLGQARTHHEIGLVHAAKRAGEMALRHFQRSLEMSRDLGLRREEAANLRELARLAIERGELEAARSHGEEALRLAESLRAKIAGDHLRTSYFTFLRKSYELYIELMMVTHAQDPTARLDILAFEAAERAHARGLLDLLQETRFSLRQGVDPGLIEQEELVRLDLNARAERLERFQAGKISSPPSLDDRRALEMDLEEGIAALLDVRAEIRRKSPRYALITEPQEIELEEIQKNLLDEDTLLLKYFLGEQSSFLWAVTSSSVTSFTLPPRAEVEAVARQAYDFLSHPDPTRPNDQRATLTALSRMILEPAAALLTGRRLVVASDGALHYIPFAVLPSPANSAIPLIVDHEVVYLPSTAVLKELRLPTARPPATTALALFADPVFGATDPRVAPDLPLMPVLNESPSDLARSAEETGGRFDRLPWTRQEAQSIFDLLADRLPKTELFLALDFASSRATVARSDLARYRILHFATHGLLNSLHPELSGLVLSLVDHEGQPTDGFLRLHDIYGLELGADLVVLSGCHTALGKEVRGEGLLSLTRGFFYAGVPSVIASLWSIRDRGTAELMVRFYRALFDQNLHPAAALRQAQIELWREHPFRDPYYWGAFVLHGDWISVGGNPANQRERNPS